MPLADLETSLTEEERAGKFTIGVLVDRDLPIYTQEYKKIRQIAKDKVAAAR